MCKALRHIERAVVMLAQLRSDVLQVGRAFWSQVHYDIEDRAKSAAYELCLSRGWKLKMHTSQRAFLVVEGDIGLGNNRFQAMRFELVLTEGSREKASRVLMPLHIDYKCTLQLCLCENHAGGSP